ncbi:MAG TPA: hypothetical protein GXZ90_01780 [Clostridiales bacterium]|nr:hypothetical protein [Clostridiales bacterium]
MWIMWIMWIKIKSNNDGLCKNAQRYRWNLCFFHYDSIDVEQKLRIKISTMFFQQIVDNTVDTVDN